MLHRRNVAFALGLAFAACHADNPVTPAPDGGVVVDAEPELPPHACSSDCLGWSSAFVGSRRAALEDVAIGPSGAVVVAGTVWNDGPPYVYAQALVEKRTAAGAPVWSVTFGGQLDDAAFAVATVPGSDDVIVGGDVDVGSIWYSNAPHGPADAFVARLDAHGQELWRVRFGADQNTNGSVDRVNDLVVLDSGDVIAIGQFADTITVGPYTLSSSGGTDMFLIRISAAGVPTFATKLGSTSYDDGDRVIATDDAIYAGITFGGNASFGAHGSVSVSATALGPTTAALARFSLTGELVWVRGRPADDLSMASSLARVAGGADVIFGGTNMTPYNSTDGSNPTGNFIVRMTPDGEKAEDPVFRDNAWKLFLRSAFTTRSGNALLVDYSGLSRLYLEAQTPTGRTRWKVEPLGKSASIASVAEGPDGSLAVVGTFWSYLAIGTTTLNGYDYQPNGFAFVLHPGVDP